MVAFSGGGDSLALLIAAKAWADAAGRRLLAVTVDHRLQEAGAAWAAWCQARCRRLGIAHQIAIWEGDKPATGVAAAARAARHGLIAQAARAAGARVVLMGHTADDRLESAFMRAAGTGVSDPAEWAPSPVWPEGRGVFILRPLLAARRADTRRALTAAGETWIDDPANLDSGQARARARIALAGGGEIDWGEPPPRCAFLLDHVIAGSGGDLTLPREVLREAPAGATRALIGAALLCVGGGGRPARGERLERLVGRLVGPAPLAATLAGARVEAHGAWIGITREAADRRRAGGGPTPLPEGAPIVWDGRFEIEASVGGLTVTPLRGLVKRLAPAARAAVKSVSTAARPGLPAVRDAAGAVFCPALVPDPRLTVRPLAFSRLAGALGAVDGEAAIARVAETLRTP